MFFGWFWEVGVGWMGFGLGWVWGRGRMGSGGLVGGLGKGFGGLGLELGSLPILSMSSLCSPYSLFDNPYLRGNKRGFFSSRCQAKQPAASAS